MDRLSQHRRSVQHDSAEDWPDWTDEGAWELGPPTEADEAWWAQQNDTWDSVEEPPDAYWDQLAGEAEALDFLERGLRPF